LKDKDKKETSMIIINKQWSALSIVSNFCVI